MRIAHDMTDHEFAEWLRKRNALNNYDCLPLINAWYDDKGNLVAVAAYDNGKYTHTVILDE